MIAYAIQAFNRQQSARLVSTPTREPRKQGSNPDRLKTRPRLYPLVLRRFGHTKVCFNAIIIKCIGDVHASVYAFKAKVPTFL